MVSITLVLISFLMFIWKIKRARYLVGGLLVVSLIDIVHYWLWFSRNENIVLLEGVIMMVAALLTFKKYGNEKTS